MACDITEKPAFYRRPDGHDVRYYANLVAEGRLRLAWEFLIRNEHFQIDCQAVRVGYSDAATVAVQWGLYKYKPFYEPFASNRKPRFASSRVSMYYAKPTDAIRHIRLSPGEVAFVLDVDRMVRSQDSRDAQLATLVRYVDAAIARRTSRRNVEPAPVSRARETNLDACLQVMDLLHCRVPSTDIKREVKYLRDAVPNISRDNKPGERGAKQVNAVNGRLRDIKQRAEALINQRGYLKLADRAHASRK
jgi:hypothetical protein